MTITRMKQLIHKFSGQAKRGYLLGSDGVGLAYSDVVDSLLKELQMMELKRDEYWKRRRK